MLNVQRQPARSAQEKFQDAADTSSPNRAPSRGRFSPNDSAFSYNRSSFSPTLVTGLRSSRQDVRVLRRGGVDSAALETFSPRSRHDARPNFPLRRGSSRSQKVLAARQREALCPALHEPERKACLRNF